MLTDYRKKSPNIKFHENPSSRSRAVPRGRTLRKLSAAFRKSVKAPKNRFALNEKANRIKNANNLKTSWYEINVMFRETAFWGSVITGCGHQRGWLLVLRSVPRNHEGIIWSSAAVALHATSTRPYRPYYRIMKGELVVFKLNVSFISRHTHNTGPDVRRSQIPPSFLTL